MRTVTRLVTAACLLLATPSPSEIFRWTDAEGRIHFTHDLSQGPAEHRSEALERTMGDESANRVQTFSKGGGGSSAAGAPPARAAPAGGASDGRPVYRIPVQRAGTSMVVPVRLNNSVTAPFLVDTGASDVAIPAWVAERLGLSAGARTRRYVTANGIIEESVVMLRRVQLGEAVVEQVPASISRTMQTGLLGLSFFNHFTYHVDAAQGVLTLVPNDLAESGAILGGRSEAQWRSEFAGLRYRIAEIEAERARTPSNHSRKLKALVAARAEVDRQRAVLEAEADEARVPMVWRD